MEDLIQFMRDASFKRENIPDMLYGWAYCFLDIPHVVEVAMVGSPSAVRNLLAQGVDASLRYGDRLNAISVLDAAALMGNLGVVRALLEHGVHANSAGTSGETALHLVVAHDRADQTIVDVLLLAGADINARTVHDLTPLHLAADRKSGDAATTLLRRGAAKDARDFIGFSPLHHAAERGNLAATRALLAAGADATLRSQFSMMSPLDVAACYGHVEVIREIAAWPGVDLDAAAPNVTGCTALHHAAASNKAVAIYALVEAGASVTVQRPNNGNTPLHQAAEFVALEGVLALLRHGAPVRPSQDDRVELVTEPPLHTAARQGGTKGAAEVVDLLLRWGADESELDSDGNTAAEVVDDYVRQGLKPASRKPAADAGRVRELLANAPADRAWRRRGLVLLCLARDRITRRRRKRSSSGGGSGGNGKGKGKGVEEGMFANDGGDGDSGGGDGGAFPSRADVGVSVTAVTAAGRGKRERTPSKVDDRRKRPGCCFCFCGGSGGGGDDGDSRGGRGGCWCEGNSENVGDLHGLAAMLLEFEHVGFFRTILGYL